MKATIYRYPHPHDPTKFIYVGQGVNRDKEHRHGRSPFGRRFLKKFPNVELPQPIIETAEVQNQFEVNELETLHIFQHHTWREYPDGMNLTLPGSTDYRVLGKLGSREGKARGARNQPREARVRGGRNQPREAKARGGHVGGRKTKESKTGIFSQGMQAKGGRIRGLQAVESGQLAGICSQGGLIQGRKNAESGQLASVRSTGHTRWHVTGTHSRTGTWYPPKVNPKCPACVIEGVSATL